MPRRAPCLPLALLALVALAQAARAESFRRCPAGRERAAAERLLAELGKAVLALGPSGDAKALEPRFDALLAHPCLAIAAREPGPRPSFTSALGLAEWWREGGESWLEAALDDGPRAVLPPDERKVLTRESAPAHPLASLFCPAADAACGREAEGWLVRAHMTLDRLRSDREEDAAELKKCSAGALRAPSSRRYLEWLSCREAHRERGPALPLGRFRVPERGWLIFTGRRGHYHFCDELRAYHLETGAAWIVQSCSGLALTDGGGVDLRRTDDGRQERVSMGRVSLENLREAALLLFLHEEIEQSAARQAVTLDLPKGVSPVAGDEGVGMGLSGGSWWSSAQTLLSWRWADGDRSLATGDLTWPDSYRHGENYAAELLQVVEAGLVEGCPPARPPAAWPWLSAGKVSGLDADPRAHERRIDELRQRLADAKLPAGCKLPGPRRSPAP